LSPFSADERTAAVEAIERAAAAVREIVLEGPAKAMNRFNKQ
jgi:peptidyl-tRNA hydrolase